MHYVHIPVPSNDGEVPHLPVFVYLVVRSLAHAYVCSLLTSYRLRFLSVGVGYRLMTVPKPFLSIRMCLGKSLTGLHSVFLYWMDSTVKYLILSWLRFARFVEGLSASRTRFMAGQS
jgi:hypothetical protein